MVAVSYAIRIGVAAFVASAVWFTMQAYAEDVKKDVFSQVMQNTAEYVEAKALHALQALEAVSEVREGLSLPQLEKMYYVNLSCEAGLLKINATALAVGKSFIIREYVNCSRINASGRVFAGDRCLVGRRVNSTYVSLVLAASC